MQGSPNAFTVPESSRARPFNVLTEQDNGARAPKRPRLTEDAVAAIHTQCADAETSLEVDHMILDYLAYQASNASLASRASDPQDRSQISLSKNLVLVNTFTALFKERHPTYTPDPELHFRMQLLKLITLFTQRFTRNPTTPSQDSLMELRKNNKARSRQWLDLANQGPTAEFSPVSFSGKYSLSNEELERNRAQVLHQLGIPPEDEQYEDAYYGTMSSVSLLDILPSFMQVSCTRMAMSNGNLTERWMHLAGEFMLQAGLEQCLVFGSTDAAVEAFSWGYLEDVELGKADPQLQEHSKEVNAMFEDEEYAMEVQGWRDVRATYLEVLFLPSNSARTDQTGFAGHLEKIASDHPLLPFETALLQFLADLSGSVPEPVLVQLEKGQLGDMTNEQTRSFLRDCGIGVAQFFEVPAGFKSGIDR